MENIKLQSSKIVSKMSDLTDIDKKQWIEFLKSCNADILEMSEFYDDFFADHLWEYDGYVEELYIDEWVWNQNTWRDLYGWPGDNQWGAIFLSNTNRIIFTNVDMNLTPYEEMSSNYEQNLIVKRFQEETKNIAVVRSNRYLMPDSSNNGQLLSKTERTILEYDYNNTKCPLCGEGYLDENEMQKLDCSHIFHPECLFRHKKTHCTICGVPQYMINVNYNYDEDIEAGLLEKESNRCLMEILTDDQPDTFTMDEQLQSDEDSDDY